ETVTFFLTFPSVRIAEGIRFRLSGGVSEKRTRPEHRRRAFVLHIRGGAATIRMSAPGPGPEGGACGAQEGQLTLTRSLPKLLPESMPMNAAGAFFNPSTISSR